MTYIPNVREKYRKPLYKNSVGADEVEEINSYWEGYLGKNEKNYLLGWDNATQEAVGTFFDNIIGCRGEESKKYLDLTLDVEFDDKKERKTVFETIKLIRDKLEDWMESERNSMVVAMMEDMNPDEYESNRNRMDKETDGEDEGDEE